MIVSKIPNKVECPYCGNNDAYNFEVKNPVTLVRAPNGRTVEVAGTKRAFFCMRCGKELEQV